MICTQCGDPSKYKCPICLEPYCSVACCKKHKENPCSPALPAKPEEIKTKHEYDFPTEDTVPVDKLKLLETSKEVKVCLENPHVRKILEVLDNSPYPDDLIQKYMQEPIFTEFVDACLKVVQNPET